MAAPAVRWQEAGWPAPAGVRVVSSWRTGGVSGPPYESLNMGDHVGDAVEAVAQNRRRLAVAAALPTRPCWLKQVHGTAVTDLDACDVTGTTEQRVAVGLTAAGEPADAAFTRRPGRVCAILTADCLPIVFASLSGEVVGAAHAGWRGLAGGVIEAVVAAMGVPPQTLVAWLGPAIGPAHFEVGAEVRDALLAEDGAAVAAFVPNERGRFMADLNALARRRLRALGVSRVYGGGECTHARADRYFSHRRDGVTGRQATLIWREP